MRRKQVHDEVARARAGVEDVDVLVAERLAELALQHLGHAGAHEIDDLLRRVDDAVRVGHLDRVALEEPLVDRVQEVLLLGKALDRGRGRLDGQVEPVERFEKVVPVERFRDQGVDHLFDLGGDHVAAGEVLVVENRADQPLGQEVLHQHLVHGGLAQVRVERVAAKLVECGECRDELRVVACAPP